jgi:hypothetical protein
MARADYSLSHAVICVARQAARRAVKRELAAQGRRKLHSIAAKELTITADEYLAEHRELIAEAKAIVAQWTAEGVFGKRAQRAALNTHAQTAKA